MITLDTPRLRLRPFLPQDAAVVQELAADYDIARTTLSVPHPYPEGAAEAWIEAMGPGRRDWERI